MIFSGMINKSKCYCLKVFPLISDKKNQIYANLKEILSFNSVESISKYL